MERERERGGGFFTSIGSLANLHLIELATFQTVDLTLKYINSINKRTTKKFNTIIELTHVLEHEDPSIQQSVAPVHE